MAQYSSLSDESPLIPTAPTTSFEASRIRTPPGTGTKRPPEAAADRIADRITEVVG